MDRFQAEHKISKIALLVALACVLQISESMIPHPIPGLRLGLANMLTLTAMVVLGFGYALEVALLRVVLSSFVMGTFMSPTFILSFGGALVSTLLMGFFYWLSGLSRHVRLSMIGISIIGAFAHNLVQLYLAYLLLIKHSGIFMFLPWLSIGAVGTGWVVGIVAGGVCRRLQADPQPGCNNSPVQTVDLRLRLYSPEFAWLHRVPAEIKLTMLCFLAVSILISTHVLVYLCVFLLVCTMILLSRTPPSFFFSVVRRYLFLISTSFFLPFLFSTAEKETIAIGIFQINASGLRLGASFAANIFLLILSSALVMRTTSPSELASGLSRLLWPLKVFGLSPSRVAEILTLSWTALPRLWETVRRTIASAQLGKIKNMRNLLPVLTDLIANLYLQTEPSNGLWDQSVVTAKEEYKHSGE